MPISPLRRLLFAAAAALLATAGPACAQSTVDASRFAAAPVAKPVRTLRDLRFRDLVQQRYDFSCGSAALASLLRYGYGYPVEETDLIRSMLEGSDVQQVVRNGFSLLDMKRYVEGRGLKGFGFRTGVDALYRLRMPVITLMDIKGYRHFVVVKGADAGRVFIADPALGHRVVPEQEFTRGWNGIVFAVIADRPLQSESWLVSNRSSPALQRRVDALERATTLPRVVEFGLVSADLF